MENLLLTDKEIPGFLKHGYPRKIIEVDFPIKRVSAHSRKEKNVRHGHISTLHVWWARRPLAACRAVLCAALWPDPADPYCPNAFIEVAKEEMLSWANNNLQLIKDEGFKSFSKIKNNPSVLEDKIVLRKILIDFICNFSDWDNSSEIAFLKTAQKLTSISNQFSENDPNQKPLVLDPFSGGGSIPLEAIRIGADAVATDLNPVAVILNKVLLQYFPVYQQSLPEKLRDFGRIVKENVEKRISEHYSTIDGCTPIAYIWARTIRCEGPNCGIAIPILTKLSLLEKEKVAVSLRPNIVNNEIVFELGNFKAGKSYVKRSSVTCPVCDFTTKGENVRKQFKGRQGGANDAKLMAVVEYDEEAKTKKYRLPNQYDLDVIAKARIRLKEYKENNIELFPSEELPYLRSIFNINLLDVTEWQDLFTNRQLLAILEFSKEIKSIELTKEPEFDKALRTCLALAMDRLADYNSSLCRWVPKGGFIGNTFSRQALGIVWDFAEVNPLSGFTGSWDSAIEWISRVCENYPASEFISPAFVDRVSATHHSLPDDSAAILCTDPPYFDLVPYADLSDFFYVLLKRCLNNLYPDLFLEGKTPKEMEIVQLAERNKIYSYKTKENYQNLMAQAMQEARRIICPGGLGLVFFAHKSTEVWETQLQSMIDSGWIITGSWPIETERTERFRAKNSAALASSIVLVCRPREDENGELCSNYIGSWRDVLELLPIRIRSWMLKLSEEGIIGADAIFACLGPALEIFSQYSKVEKSSGDTVSLKEYLESVWATVAKEALNMIFEGADTTGFEEDARLTAIWLWTLSTGMVIDEDDSETEDIDECADEEDESSESKKISGFVLEYDAARKISQALGVHLNALNKLVAIKKDKAVLLPVAERARFLFGKESNEVSLPQKKKVKQLDLFEVVDSAESEWDNLELDKGILELANTTLDKIHQSMILFATGRSEALKRYLTDDGVGKDQRFWKLAQALSALYPAGTDEKRWVDGVLARKKGLGL